MPTPVIAINMDKACKECGQMGTAQGGICIDCAAKKILPINKIGQKTIRAITDQVEAMLQTYLAALNRAYLNEENLKVGFSTDITPGTGGDLVLTTKISFVESRVKDETQMTVNEAQIGLFEEGEDAQNGKP